MADFDFAAIDPWKKDSEATLGERANNTAASFLGGIKEGFGTQLPAQIGEAVQAGRPVHEGEPSVADRLAEEAEAQAAENAKDTSPTLFGTTAGQFRNEVAQQIPQSAGMVAGMAVGRAASALGAPLGPLGMAVAGGAASLVPMYLQQKTAAAKQNLRGLEKQRGPMTTEQKLAEQEAMQPDVSKQAVWEVGTELPGMALEAVPIFGELGKAGTPVLRRLLSKQTAKAVGKGAAKELGAMALSEPIEETVSQIGERELQNKYQAPEDREQALSFSKPEDYLKAYKEVLGPTLRGMLPLMAFGAIAAGSSHAKQGLAAGKRFEQGLKDAEYQDLGADAKALDALNVLVGDADTIMKKPEWDTPDMREAVDKLKSWRDGVASVQPVAATSAAPAAATPAAATPAAATPAAATLEEEAVNASNTASDAIPNVVGEGNGIKAAEGGEPPAAGATGGGYGGQTFVRVNRLRGKQPPHIGQPSDNTEPTVPLNPAAGPMSAAASKAVGNKEVEIAPEGEAQPGKPFEATHVMQNGIPVMQVPEQVFNGRVALWTDAKNRAYALKYAQVAPIGDTPPTMPQPAKMVPTPFEATHVTPDGTPVEQLLRLDARRSIWQDATGERYLYPANLNPIGAEDAITEGRQPEDNQPEHQGASQVGAPAEAGGGNRLVAGAEIQPQTTQKTEDTVNEQSQDATQDAAQAGQEETQEVTPETRMTAQSLAEADAVRRQVEKHTRLHAQYSSLLTDLLDCYARH